MCFDMGRVKRSSRTGADLLGWHRVATATLKKALPPQLPPQLAAQIYIYIYIFLLLQYIVKSKVSKVRLQVNATRKYCPIPPAPHPPSPRLPPALILITRKARESSKRTKQAARQRDYILEVILINRLSMKKL